MFYLEVDVAVLVHVEGAEHMVTELYSVPGWEEHLIHVYKFSWGQPAVRAVLLQRNNKKN